MCSGTSIADGWEAAFKAVRGACPARDSHMPNLGECLVDSALVRKPCSVNLKRWSEGPDRYSHPRSRSTWRKIEMVLSFSTWLFTAILIVSGPSESWMPAPLRMKVVFTRTPHDFVRVGAVAGNAAK